MSSLSSCHRLYCVFLHVDHKKGRKREEKLSLMQVFVSTTFLLWKEFLRPYDDLDLQADGHT